MESALCPLADHLCCDICKKSLAERVKQLIVQWSVVKVRRYRHVACAYAQIVDSFVRVVPCSDLYETRPYYFNSWLHPQLAARFPLTYAGVNSPD